MLESAGDRCKAAHPLLEGERDVHCRDGHDTHPFIVQQLIPTIPESVKSARSGFLSKLTMATWLAALVSSCGPVVENAPFSARPDTLRPGDLLGPFDGLVVDGETDHPLAGVVVAGAWAFERGIGLQGPAAALEAVAETGADGRYRLKIPEDLPRGDGVRLRRFTLIAYRRGYVAWRSDSIFPTGEPRTDFAQRGTRVHLEKWQSSMSHFRHLAFLGGGPAIRAAAAWEVQPAGLELDGASPASASERPAEAARVGSSAALDISPLLSEDEVRGVTGYAGKFEVGKLADRATSDVYDSRHFKASDKPETHDVGLRVWAIGSDAAEAQFRKLLGYLPNAVATEEMGDASLRARGGDVTGFAFLLREKGVVMQLSCGLAQCSEPSMILRLAKLAESHLPEVKLPSPESTGLLPPSSPAFAPGGKL